VVAQSTSLQQVDMRSLVHSVAVQIVDSLTNTVGRSSDSWMLLAEGQRSRSLSRVGDKNKVRWAEQRSSVVIA